MLNIAFSLGVKGFYTFTAVSCTTGARRLLGVVDNLVTDFGYENWGDAYLYAFCALGSSNTEPEYGDSGLGNQLYERGWSTSTSGHNETPPYGYRRFQFIFPAGTLLDTVREIGIKAGAGQLVSHALLKDADGNPVELDLAPDEELEIIYEVRSYITMGDNVQYLTTKGVEYKLESRAAGILGAAAWVPGELPAGLLCGIYNGPAGDEYGEPSGSWSVINPSIDSYSGIESGVRFLVWDFKVLVGQGNLAGGIQSMLFLPSGKGAHQVQITPPILKTNKDVLNFSIKFRWERL